MASDDPHRQARPGAPASLAAPTPALNGAVDRGARTRSGLAVPSLDYRVVEWLRQNPKHGWGDDAVPGADDLETAHLFALGGFANPLVHPRGSSQITGWPDDVLAWASAPEPPSNLSADLRAHAVKSRDVLATIYEQLVRASNRRRLGTFFTPQVLVDHMLSTAERLIGGPPAVIVDPGAGVGAFSVPAVERWRTDAVAVDVNPVTLGLLGIASALQGQSVTSWGGLPQRRGRRVHLAHTDFISWIGPFLKGATRRNALILGNPPYTRHQSLTADQKEAASRLSGDLVSSNLAGLSSYFLAVTLRHMRAEDSLVLLLPSNWLDTRYAREIRAHIWGLRHRRTELHVFPTELEVFAGTQVAAVVLAIGPRRDGVQPFVIRPAHLGANAVTTSKLVAIDRGKPIPADFSRLLDDGPGRAVRAQSLGALLGDIAVVRRGVATGANNHYFLGDGEIGSMAPGALTPAMVRLKGFTGRELDQAAHDALGADGSRRWLVDFHDFRGCDRAALPPALGSFVDALEEAGVHKRYLLAARGERWWVPEVVSPAHLLIGPMTKAQFRVVRNSVDAVHSNTLYGLTLRDGQPASAVNMLQTWLESADGQLQLTKAARRHATGLLKLEPRALKMVELPPDLTLTG